jgi:hypothetical protein
MKTELKKIVRENVVIEMNMDETLLLLDVLRVWRADYPYKGNTLDFVKDLDTSVSKTVLQIK